MDFLQVSIPDFIQDEMKFFFCLYSGFLTCPFNYKNRGAFQNTKTLQQGLPYFAIDEIYPVFAIDSCQMSVRSLWVPDVD